MAKSPRHSVNLKLLLREFAALANDAASCSTSPTTMALCSVLAGMQRFRDVVPDLLVPGARAILALDAAARALRAAGKTSVAAAAQAAARELRRTYDRVVERSFLIVAPGWRLAAYRHRIAWGGETPGRPALPEPLPGSLLPTSLARTRGA